MRCASICYCFVSSLALIVLALLFGLGADVVANHGFVVKLPQGTCDFTKNANFVPVSSLGLGYVNVYNVTFIPNVSLNTTSSNKTITVKYGPPPSWYLKTTTNYEIWVISVNGNSLSCYYDKIANVVTRKAYL